MVDCTPDPNLLESMRSVGYNLNTAIADIIDNSIAANAESISIRYFDHGEDPYMAIIDDGDGMDYETAVNAMKLAGTSPNATRNNSDLGRFGLGLKTASLSQARSVMVSTVQNGHQHTLCWDLDHVAQTHTWDLETMDERQTSLELPEKVRDLMPSSHGTCVLWRKLDRLENVAGASLQDIDRAMSELSSYLGLVFHRFLHPYPEDSIRRIAITVNDSPVPERDPFLVNNLATQRQRTQRIPGTAATLCGYTLPHQNKLTAKDRQLLDLRQEKGHTLLDTQGFYIYRAYRLITWGSWFRLLARKESTKLSRVQVDIPNTMDEEWTLDIKKSQATPPKTIRDAMKRYVERLAAPSRRTQQFRGRKTSDDPEAHVWDIINDREGVFRYEINTDNPYVKSFVETLTPEQHHDFSSMIKVFAAAFPYADMQSRLSVDEHSAENHLSDEEIRDWAKDMWKLASQLEHITSADFVRKFKVQEPFSLHPESEAILKEVSHDR